MYVYVYNTNIIFYVLFYISTSLKLLSLDLVHSYMYASMAPTKRGARNAQDGLISRLVTPTLEYSQCHYRVYHSPHKYNYNYFLVITTPDGYTYNYNIRDIQNDKINRICMHAI